MIYFAYGSNLCQEQMKRRCPDAKPLGSFLLSSARLVFRGVADVVRAEGESCHGALWRITPRCERALDGYEGIDGGMYKKIFVPLKKMPGENRLMFYVMNSSGVFPPSEEYLSVIERGYRDFRLPLSYLHEAVRSSWANKNPSYVERQRYARVGRPRLARVPSGD